MLNRTEQHEKTIKTAEKKIGKNPSEKKKKKKMTPSEKYVHSQTHIYNSGIYMYDLNTQRAIKTRSDGSW